MSKPKTQRLTLDRTSALFSLTLLLSAGLMFAVQPMVGKMLLPLVGGAPSGWLVAMAYFQLALLAGYYFAHRLSFFSLRIHGLVICLLLTAGLLVQPVNMPADLLEIKALPESFLVFLALFFRLTIPFVALSMLSPSLQRLFAASDSPSAKDPYFLFAASNIGSFGGLLLYPLWMERMMGLSVQSLGWLAGYVALIVLCGTCFLMVVRKPQRAAARKKAKSTVTSWPMRLRWMVLAFVPSSLMLGVTAHITVDIGSVPFFWVLPLSLYLLTFVLAFARPKNAGTGFLTTLQPVSVALLVMVSVEQPSIVTSGVQLVVMTQPVIAFLITSLLAHYTLASLRPEPARLTEFYLCVATGGALGGIFNAFLAPFLFPLPIEFFLVLLGSCFLFPPPKAWLFTKNRFTVTALVLLSIITAVALRYVRFYQPSETGLCLTFTLLLGAGLFGLVGRPKVLALTSAALGLIAVFTFSEINLRDVERNFFGVVRVFEQQQDDITLRSMSHGSTIHGQQKVAPENDTKPNAYYHPKGPLGDIMALAAPRNVGIIGMGTAGIICYKAKGREYTYYEIDPVVPALADKWFDFIKECGAPRVVIGDGRKMLAQGSPKPYDLLIVDAFTSDAIPMNLLTKEALEAYMGRLTPGGIVAFHISNHFYDLRGPLNHMVQELGLSALARKYRTEDKNKFGFSSDWVVIARKPAKIQPLKAKGWADLPAPTGRLWTDDYSNLLAAVRLD